ncbi:SDR family NAD(P)-dependent oxidoreductase [Marinigracilibium pacificum]|uniref:SDR family oxidoreductase n=1 Tax=Marinigracilibium pacificum TaxID=2729599 RepID=A0A848J1K0_9BACT|nr:SDR family oxidoreductase [Marinigracilibium pacificum]NMM50693.1 SDR family oxidoreductase [Marinigracilibium pacificum]
MKSFNGKVVVITGGNSGIGYETAKKYKSLGAEVVIIGRSEDRIRKSANEIGATGLVADVLDVSALDKASIAVKEKFGKVDILFVNAGVFFGSPVGQTPEEMFDQQVGINFKGAVYTIEKFLPLIPEGGSILALSSILANTGMANSSIYSATKAALNAYARSAATELAERKIRVNIINPGPINTPIYGKTGMAEEQLDGFAQAMQDRVPLKTFGTPEDVANLVVFISSDDAKFINGSEINVDGGININPVLG